MITNLSIDPYVLGLPPKECEQLRDLVNVYNYHLSGNATKDKYYEGKITLNDVNLGIALPDGRRKLEIGCEWGAKCVDVLASRSMFDGFVSENGNEAEEVTKICESNHLISQYMKACKDELKYGCTFATLSNHEDGCRIRFHSPLSASALWNGEEGRIDCGLAIIDTAYDESDKTWKPSILNMYTDTDVWELLNIGGTWEAIQHPHFMGRPLMEPMIWNATMSKPFGRSRIKEPVRRLIEGYVRTIANATIGLEFATSPQKYLLGVTDDQYDAIVNQKFKQYVGSILASTDNPETGERPSFGQLSQGSIEPHVQMIRILATQFSAATGLSVTDTGVVNDANPTSSEAIIAQTQTLILLAEQLNQGNGNALKNIILMAQAINNNVTVEELSDNQKNVIAHFKNPSMPSVAQTSDAATKIASVRSEFASTDTFLEMLGFSQADIRRIKGQEARVRGMQVLTEEFNNDNQSSELEEVRTTTVVN